MNQAIRGTGTIYSLETGTGTCIRSWKQYRSEESSALNLSLNLSLNSHEEYRCQRISLSPEFGIVIPTEHQRNPWRSHFRRIK